MSTRRPSRLLLAAGAAVLLATTSCTVDDPPADAPGSAEVDGADTSETEVTEATTTGPAEAFDEAEQRFLDGIASRDVQVEPAAMPTTVEVGHGICARIDGGESPDRIAEQIEPFAESLQAAGGDSPSAREIADILIAESERSLCAQ